MFAYIALFAWPIVVMILFAKKNPGTALIWSILGGYLLLPNRVQVDLPVLPALNKDSIPVFAAMLGAALWLSRTKRAQRMTHQQMKLARSGPFKLNGQTILPGILPRGWVVRGLLALLIGGAFMTARTNPDPQIFGETFLRGLRPYDAFSDILNSMVLILPFLLARKYLAHPDAHKDIIRIICIAGLAYTLLALIEVRLSPQLHNWIYGFHAHSFGQAKRGGGFRPTIFLEHGLFVGLYFTMAVTCAFAYFRMGHTKFGLAAAWLFLVLILVKSLGALLIAVVLIPMVMLLTKRMMMLISAGIVVVFLVFPMLRSAGWIPVDQISNFAGQVDPRRQQSLQFRFDNEDILLEKASQRPVYGWGGFARSRVYNENGRDISVTDGVWIIALGEGGWVRYIGQFGLLTFAVLMLTLRKRKYEIALPTAALCVLMAGNLVDMLPNSGMTVLTWLFAGALAGRLELQPQDVSETAEQEVENPGRAKAHQPGYARPRPAHVAASKAPDLAAKSKAPRYARSTPRPRI